MRRLALATRGFTLIELITVLVLIGIAGSISVVFLTQPVQAYLTQTRRAELVDAAEMALQRMARDIRRAVPNSVRVNPPGNALEMLNSVDGGRYRAAPPGTPKRILDFTRSDTSFNVLGPFGSPGTTTTHALVIYNLGITGADAYAGTDVITPSGTAITISPDGAESRVGLDFSGTANPSFRFAHESPGQRVYLVDGAVSYVCAGGALYRAGSYPFGPVQPSAGSGALVTEHVSECRFSYDPAVTATRAGLVTLTLTLTKDGESVRLVRQVHVQNAP